MRHPITGQHEKDFHGDPAGRGSAHPNVICDDGEGGADLKQAVIASACRATGLEHGWLTGFAVLATVRGEFEFSRRLRDRAGQGDGTSSHGGHGDEMAKLRRFNERAAASRQGLAWPNIIVRGSGSACFGTSGGNTR